MIATASAPDNAAAPQSWLIADRASGCVFDPTATFDPTHPGKFNPWVGPFAGPLAPAAAAKYLVGPASASTIASARPWPSAGAVLVWAFLGSQVPGDQLVAIPYGADGTRIAGSWDVLMTIADERRHAANGGIVLDAPGVLTGAPASPTPAPPATA